MQNINYKESINVHFLTLIKAIAIFNPNKIDESNQLDINYNDNFIDKSNNSIEIELKAIISKLIEDKKEVLEHQMECSISINIKFANNENQFDNYYNFLKFILEKTEISNTIFINNKFLDNLTTNLLPKKIIGLMKSNVIVKISEFIKNDYELSIKETETSKKIDFEIFNRNILLDPSLDSEVSITDFIQEYDESKKIINNVVYNVVLKYKLIDIKNKTEEINYSNLTLSYVDKKFTFKTIDSFSRCFTYQSMIQSMTIDQNKNLKINYIDGYTYLLKIGSIQVIGYLINPFLEGELEYDLKDVKESIRLILYKNGVLSQTKSIVILDIIETSGLEVSKSMSNFTFNWEDYRDYQKHKDRTTLILSRIDDLPFLPIDIQLLEYIRDILVLIYKNESSNIQNFNTKLEVMKIWKYIPSIKELTPYKSKILTFIFSDLISDDIKITFESWLKNSKIEAICKADIFDKIKNAMEIPQTHFIILKNQIQKIDNNIRFIYRIAKQDYLVNNDKIIIDYKRKECNFQLKVFSALKNNEIILNENLIESQLDNIWIIILNAYIQFKNLNKGKIKLQFITIKSINDKQLYFEVGKTLINQEISQYLFTNTKAIIQEIILPDIKEQSLGTKVIITANSKEYKISIKGMNDGNYNEIIPFPILNNSESAFSMELVKEFAISKPEDISSFDIKLNQLFTKIIKAEVTANRIIDDTIHTIKFQVGKNLPHFSEKKNIMDSIDEIEISESTLRVSNTDFMIEFQLFEKPRLIIVNQSIVGKKIQFNLQDFEVIDFQDNSVTKKDYVVDNVLILGQNNLDQGREIYFEKGSKVDKKYTYTTQIPEDAIINKITMYEANQSVKLDYSFIDSLSNTIKKDYILEVNKSIAIKTIENNIENVIIMHIIANTSRTVIPTIKEFITTIDLNFKSKLKYN